MALEELQRRKSRRHLDTFFPDEGPYRRELYQRHLEFFRAGREHHERLFLAANRIGKALKHGTDVATPTGWRPIEALAVGDDVIAGDGSVTRVVGVYPQGEKPLYRLTFDVGDAVTCCGEHLWKYRHPRARYPYRQSHGAKQANPFYGEWTVGSTERIMNAVGCEPIPRMRVVMPTCQPWAIPAQPVPLDPYLVGVLIGDGGIKQCVNLTSADQEIVDAVALALPGGVSLIKRPGADPYAYAISKPGGHGHLVPGELRGNSVLDALRGLGLMGCGSAQKFVPEGYKINAPDVRLAVLQGLMDTDGYISRSGAMEFSSISRKLADDVAFLVHSLGGKVSIEQRQTHYTHKGERRAGQPSYRVRIRLNVCPFRLARKAERWNPRHNTADRVLHLIEPSGVGLATCIEVEHESHTFVTAHGIVTHNTESAGGYETTLHLTGMYPPWWDGWRCSHPISAWAAGASNETTRDIIQAKLTGGVQWDGNRKGVKGTGLIPGELIGQIAWKQGVNDLIDTVQVKHVSGGWSTLGLKSYQQGRKSFEGTEKDWIWLDEECPEDVYSECLIRTMTTNGRVVLTFTPLEGLTPLVLSFLPGGKVLET